MWLTRTDFGDPHQAVAFHPWSQNMFEARRTFSHNAARTVSGSLCIPVSGPPPSLLHSTDHPRVRPTALSRLPTHVRKFDDEGDSAALGSSWRGRSNATVDSSSIRFNEGLMRFVDDWDAADWRKCCFLILRRVAVQKSYEAGARLSRSISTRPQSMQIPSPPLSPWPLSPANI